MKIISSEDRSKERLLLREVVPLKFPLTVNVNVSNICNFKCYYCLQSHPNDPAREFPKLGVVMKFDDFRKCMDNIISGGVLKHMILVGNGEPLINRELPDMVRYAKNMGVAKTIEVITNGALLTPELSDVLIDAGLDLIRISLQGITAEQYKENSKVDIDFSKFIDQIRYFYNRRGNCRVIVKIMGEMIKTEEDYQRLKGIFDDIADGLYVENILPTNGFEGADVSLFDKDRYGTGTLTVKTCTQPFFTALVNYDGKVYACCRQTLNPPLIGDIKANPITAIWNRGAHKKLLLDLLNHDHDSHKGCDVCDVYKYICLPSDCLDGFEDEIKSRMNMV